MNPAQPARPRAAARSQKPPNGGLLTAGQVARRWQVPTSQVYRLTRDGHLPVVRLGRYYRYLPAAVEEFERGGGVASDA